MLATKILLIGVVVGVVVIGAALWYMTAVPGRSFSGTLPPLTADEAGISQRLRRHIEAIARIPHNIAHFADLERAARYIEAELKALGYEPVLQTYMADGKAVRNIEAVIEPAGTGSVSGTLVVGAHYDSYGDAPGANDNGTGVAAVIELARLLADLRGRSPRKVRLVLFVNEEPPYFQTSDMGSLRYAKLLAERREPLVGMISLETIGCFFDQAGTQHYPAPFGLLYPSTGNFVAFVGMLGSRDFVRSLVGSFRAHTEFPSVGGVAPGFIPGIAWSDHWSFAQFGYPAAVITDTAPFRYAHYHETSDTPDKVDFDKLARVTKGVERMVREIASSNDLTAVTPRRQN
jgi:Zn-dependent M28 family amino/carboxypeptidase